MVLFSIDWSANTAHLNKTYQEIISGRSRSNATIKKVRELAFNLIELHFHWNEENWTNWVIEKINKILKKFKDDLVNDDFKILSHWEIIASCSDKWATGLKELWIKKIKVWSRYHIVWVDMITKELWGLKELQESILFSFAIERRYELRYGQMCKSFELAATKLGILEIEKEDEYFQEEIVESVEENWSTTYNSAIVTFASGKIEILDNIHYSNIEKWDKFSFIYADPEYKTQLQIKLLNKNWQKVQKWISDEYTKFQKEDRTNFVEIVREWEDLSLQKILAFG